MEAMTALLEQSAALHHHLCPRQVLGVRLSLLAGELLGLAVPQPKNKKRLLAIVETDGCAADGVAVAANCWVGRRTMRIEDYGKVAATFVDTDTGRAVRVAPHPEARQRARAYAPEARNRWEAMLLGYQRMPAGELLIAQTVTLNTPVASLISRPGIRAMCESCQEEILNEREVRRPGEVLCRSCAGHSYYQVTLSATRLPPVPEP